MHRCRKSKKRQTMRWLLTQSGKRFHSYDLDHLAVRHSFSPPWMASIFLGGHWLRLTHRCRYDLHNPRTFPPQGYNAYFEGDGDGFIVEDRATEVVAGKAGRVGNPFHLILDIFWSCRGRISSAVMTTAPFSKVLRKLDLLESLVASTSALLTSLAYWKISSSTPPYSSPIVLFWCRKVGSKCTRWYCKATR